MVKERRKAFIKMKKNIFQKCFIFHYYIKLITNNNNFFYILKLFF